MKCVIRWISSTAGLATAAAAGAAGAAAARVRVLALPQAAPRHPGPPDKPAETPWSPTKISYIIIPPWHFEMVADHTEVTAGTGVAGKGNGADGFSA